MITLQKHQYDVVSPMLSDIPGAPWHLASMINRNIGTVIVDDFPNPTTVYLETPFFMYYFAGTYNKSFMEDMINHIIKDLVPAGETRPAFIFSSDQEWKNEIERYLKPFVSKEVGAYLTRRVYHLNDKQYGMIKDSFAVPREYTFKIENRNGQICSVALYHGEEVSHCSDGGQGLGYMEFEVFTAPEHRKKGLALICGSYLIDYCLQHNFMPQWTCFAENISSCKIAEKLGFEMTAETQVNLAEIKNDPII